MNEQAWNQALPAGSSGTGANRPFVRLLEKHQPRLRMTATEAIAALPDGYDGARRSRAAVDGDRLFAMAKTALNLVKNRLPQPPRAHDQWPMLVALAARIAQSTMGAEFTLKTLLPPEKHSWVLIGLAAHNEWEGRPRAPGPTEAQFQNMLPAAAGDPTDDGGDDDDADNPDDDPRVHAGAEFNNGLSQKAGMVSVTVKRSPLWGPFFEPHVNWTTLTHDARGAPTVDVDHAKPAAAFANLYDAVGSVNPHRLERRTTASTLGSWTHSLVEHHLLKTFRLECRPLTDEEDHMLGVFYVQTSHLLFPRAIAKYMANAMCSLALRPTVSAARPIAMTQTRCSPLYAVIMPGAHTIPMLRVGDSAPEASLINFIPDGIIYNAETNTLHVYELKTVWGTKSQEKLDDTAGVPWRTHRRQAALQALAVALTPGDDLRARFEAEGWPTKVVATVIVVRASASEEHARGARRPRTRRANIRIGDSKIMQCVIPVTHKINRLIPSTAMGRTLAAQLLIERANATRGKRCYNVDNNEEATKANMQNAAAAVLWNVVPRGNAYARTWATVLCTGPVVSAATLKKLKELILPVLTEQYN